MQTIIFALVSVFLVSLISFIGVFSLTLGEQKVRAVLTYIISFAAGALLGNALIHLLPVAFTSTLSSFMVSLGTLAGIITLFIIEKLFYWHHCHHLHHEHGHCHHIHAHGVTNLIGDSLHNIVDGIIIAGSFLVSIPLGLTTTLAVALHEIPQEISDFGILLHAGFSARNALLFNFLSGLFALIGAIPVFAVAPIVANLQLWLIPFTAGSFIYIACCNLIPELLKEAKLRTTILQSLFLILGIGIMVGLKIMK